MVAGSRLITGGIGFGIFDLVFWDLTNGLAIGGGDETGNGWKAKPSLRDK